MIRPLTPAEFTGLSPAQRQMRSMQLRHAVDRLQTEHHRRFHGPVRAAELWTLCALPRDSRGRFARVAS